MLFLINPFWWFLLMISVIFIFIEYYYFHHKNDNSKIMESIGSWGAIITILIIFLITWDSLWIFSNRGVISFFLTVIFLTLFCIITGKIMDKLILNINKKYMKKIINYFPDIIIIIGITILSYNLLRPTTKRLSLSYHYAEYKTFGIILIVIGIDIAIRRYFNFKNPKS